MSNLFQFLIPILFVFIVPAFLFIFLLDFLLYRLFGFAGLRHYEKEEEGEIQKYSYNMKIVVIVGIILWGSLISYFVYNEQFTTETYVYACREESSRCYRVKADMEYDEGYRGISRIYFNQNEYVSMEDCENEKGSNNYYCYSTDDEWWSMEKVEERRVRRN